MPSLRQLLAQRDEDVLELQKEIRKLKTQIEYARGVPVERLIAEWTGGEITAYKHSHDVTTKKGKLLEVKYSKIHTQKTKRWVWDSLRGENRTKIYHFLVLAGSKEGLYGYPDDLQYALFLLPLKAVEHMNRDSVALNTNLQKARGLHAPLLINHLVHSRSEFLELLEDPD